MLDAEIEAMTNGKEIAVKAPSASERLEKLGFADAAARLKVLTERKRKLAIAYEHYRFVREEKITAFNRELERKEPPTSKNGYQYKQLSFTPVSQYTEVPPEHVLASLEVAMERKCFDRYAVAHIVTKVKTPDPILFGMVDGCSDCFFIDQWDEDVKIEDILKDNEG